MKATKVMEAPKPERFFFQNKMVPLLMSLRLKTSFCSPNNYKLLRNFTKTTFQHGGVSLEAMIIPYNFTIFEEGLK